MNTIIFERCQGTGGCALCELTYSPVGKRRQWAGCEPRLGVPVEELHRDRLPAAWEISPSELPCILGRSGDDRPFVLLGRADIEACHRRIDEL